MPGSSLTPTLPFDNALNLIATTGSGTGLKVTDNGGDPYTSADANAS